MFVGLMMFLQDVKSGQFALFYASTLSWFTLGALIVHSYYTTFRIILFIEMMLSWLTALWYFIVVTGTTMFISLNYQRFSGLELQQLVYPCITISLFLLLTASFTINFHFPRKQSVSEEFGRIDLQAIEDLKLERNRIILSCSLWALFFLGYVMETLYFIFGAPLISEKDSFYTSLALRLLNGIGTCLLLTSLSAMIMNSSHQLQSMSPLLKSMIYMDFVLLWTLPLFHIAKMSSIIVWWFTFSSDFDKYYAFVYGYVFTRMYLGVLYFVCILSISMFHFRELMAQRFREWFMGDVPAELREALGENNPPPQEPNQGEDATPIQPVIETVSPSTVPQETSVLPQGHTQVILE
jgi:hypothetical protein